MNKFIATILVCIPLLPALATAEDKFLDGTPVAIYYATSRIGDVREIEVEIASAGGEIKASKLLEKFPAENAWLIHYYDKAEREKALQLVMLIQREFDESLSPRLQKRGLLRRKPKNQLTLYLE